MTGIIEKLGITPGPWRLSTNFVRDSFISGPTGNFKNIICQPPGAQKTYRNGEYAPWDNNKHLIAAAPEMLERDIKFLKTIENLSYDINKGFITNPMFLMRKIIESFDFSPDQKATGKSWEEIKELLP